MKRKLKVGYGPIECIEVFSFYKLSNLKIITLLLINRNRYNNCNQLNKTIITQSIYLSQFFLFIIHQQQQIDNLISINV